MKHRVSWSLLLAVGGGCWLFSNALIQPASAASNPAQTQPASAANLTPAATEVIRLAGSGVGEDVILAYIQNSQSAFSLSVDDVLYLKDVGLSSAVISAMLNHDAAMRNQPAPAAPRTEAPAPAPAPETTEPETAVVKNAPADVTYFYDDLAPYGAWVQLADVGWCWQPRAAAANSSWRPYCDSGHWVYTDAGWFWQSDYSWGWAPFHYGRWALHDRVGWVWAPDRVWAPAWVVWRSAGDHCGWAPLPPHAVLDARGDWRFNGATVGATFDFGLRPEQFTFVALRDFAERDLRRHQLPPTQVRTLFPQTTVFNRYALNRRTVTNPGIPVQRVASAGAPIPRATIHDSPRGSHGGPQPQNPGPGPGVVYRPDLKAPSKAPTVVAQRVDDRHPAIQHPAITPGPPQRPTPTSPWAPAGSPGRQPAQPTGGSQGQPGQPSPGYPQNVHGVPGMQPGQGTPSSGSPTGPSRQGKQPPGGGSGASVAPTGPPSGAPSRSSDPGRQPSRPTSGYQSDSRGSPSSPPSRPSDQGKQPSRSGPSYQPESRNPSSGPSSRPSDQGNQPSRTGPSSQPGSSPGGPPKKDQP
jgi:hypothetical protein